ncbi:MAG: hypothetical protein KJN95_05830 [Gammaproteobacteria bacterium]|nr:hypothetical protein [Gammaproteobacteria bacterium]
MRTGLYLLLLGIGLILQPAAAGDILTIPGHVPVAEKQMMPKRGISMDEVLGEFGEPDERYGPVGEPPITEWVYGSFRVYFEHHLVLHTIDLNTIVMPE